MRLLHDEILIAVDPLESVRGRIAIPGRWQRDNPAGIATVVGAGPTAYDVRIGDRVAFNTLFSCKLRDAVEGDERDVRLIAPYALLGKMVDE
jgi:hypothetical protein